jgi:hypothetical protein
MGVLPFAGTLVLALGLSTGLAEAKTCKDAVTAKARSSAQVSDASRERRARDKAISNWGRRARDTYGIAYSFWRRSEEQKVACGGGSSAKTCTVSAKPCRVY